MPKKAFQLISLLTPFRFRWTVPLKEKRAKCHVYRIFQLWIICWVPTKANPHPRKIRETTLNDDIL
jgi:hypothetical protein